MLRTLLSILVLSAYSTTASATPVTYEFSGSGSGTIDGVSFTDAEFSFVTNADTEDIQSDSIVFSQENLTGVLRVDGFAPATITENVRIFNNFSSEVVGIGHPGGDLLNVADQQGVGLDTYDLSTSFGPVTTSNPVFGQFQFVGSDLGDITFSDMTTLTFQATVVPEPNSLVLLCLGVLLVSYRLR